METHWLEIRNSTDYLTKHNNGRAPVARSAGMLRALRTSQYSSPHRSYSSIPLMCNACLEQGWEGPSDQADIRLLYPSFLLDSNAWVSS